MSLFLAAIGVCSVLAYFIGQEVLKPQLTSLVSGLRAAHAASTQPTIVLVWPTATPSIVAISPLAPSEAIAFTQGFRYDPGQRKNVLDLINALQAASRKLGNDVVVDGWKAEKQEQGQWVVSYAYQEGPAPRTFRFLVDPDTEYIKAHDDGGDTVLTFLREDAQSGESRPTATPVTISTGWAMRDYFTRWEYHVPTDVQLLETIEHSGHRLHSDNGFLVIPLSLHNLAKGTRTLRADYYSRFALKDTTGTDASLNDEDHLKAPTRLLCRARALPEWTDKSISVSSDGTVSTAVAFELLPDVTPPFVLEITVYELSTPHRFNVRLTIEKQAISSLGQ